MARKPDNNGDSLFSFGESSRNSGVPGKRSSSKAQVPGMSDASSSSIPGIGKSKKQGLVPGEGRADTESASLFAPPGSQKQDMGPMYGYSKHRFHKGDEVSAYTESMDRRYSMNPNVKRLIFLSVLVIVLLFTTTVLPTGFMSEERYLLGPAYFIDLLMSNMGALGNWISGIPDGNGLQIVFWQNFTLVFVGASLALNGAVYQGALKNALASPSTLGVMSGGTLGSIIYTLVIGVPETMEIVTFTNAEEVSAQLDVLNPLEYIWATQARALCALAGSFIVVMLVLLIAHIAGKGKVSKPALVIAGQVFAQTINAVVGVVRAWVSANGSDEQLSALQSMAGGSVSYIMGPFDFLLIAVPVTIGIFIIMKMRFKLNLLAFNDEEAKSMGLSVAASRNIMVAVCTIMSAIVVSFCGNVGFVGFLVPNLVRKLVGPDFRYLIPASALVGASYLLISNYVMNLGNFLSGSLGSFTSIIGVVFFLAMAVRERKRGNIDWI